MINDGKPKAKYIHCDIYKRGIYVFIGNLDEFKEWSIKTFTDESEKGFVDMITHLKEEDIGAASFYYDNNNGEGATLISKFPETPKEYAVLVHELLHATFFMLNFCGIEYSYSGNNECYTYLLEHLTRNALEDIGYENINN